MYRFLCAGVLVFILSTTLVAAPLVFQEDFEDPNWFDGAGSAWTKEGAGHPEVSIVQFADADSRLGETAGSIGSNSGGLSFSYVAGSPPLDVLYSGGDKEEVYLDYHMVVAPGEYTFEVSFDRLIYWGNAAGPDPQAYGQGQTFYIGDGAAVEYGSQIVATIPDGPWQGHSWTAAEDATRIGEEQWNGTCQDKPDIDPEVLGLAYDAATDTLYGSETFTDQLVKIEVDPNTGQLGRMTVVGPMGFTDVQGLAFNPATNTLYGSDIDLDVLITIDPATGQGTAVGALGFGNVRGLAYDADAGVLYGSDTSADVLLTINTGTGAGTSIGLTGYNNVRGLAFDTSTVLATLYGSDTSNDELITLATATGAGTTVGSLGFDLIRGLAYDSNRDLLYGTDPVVDELILVDRVTGLGTTLAALNGSVDPVQPVVTDCSEPGATQGAVGAVAYNGLWFHETFTTHMDGSDKIIATDRGDGLGEVVFRMTMRSKDNDTAQATHALDNLVVTLSSLCPDPFADTDEDGDVDQDDFAAFQVCYTGSDDPSGVFDQSACGCFNRDGGSPPDVDQADFEAFQQCASGPALTADPNCDG